MKRLFLFLVCGMLWLFPVSAHAAQPPSLHLTPSASELTPEQTYQVDISLQGYSDLKLIAGKITVEYDSRLTLTSITPSSISKNDFKFTMESWSAKGIYASSGQGIPQGTTFLTLVFTVNEDATPGPSNVTVSITNLVDSQLQRVPEKLTQSTSLSVTKQNLPQAFLASLVPSEGTLEPEFSPGHTEYEITVPYEVTSLTFDAEPGEGGTVQVNRKNLERAGTPTTFTITVTAADHKTKTFYTVTVHRLEKQETSSSKVTEAVLVKTASSRTSTRSTNFSNSSSAETEEHVTTQPASEPAAYQNRYVSQNTNRMPEFLIWILCGVAGLVLAALVTLLVSKRRKGPKK